MESWKVYGARYKRKLYKSVLKAVDKLFQSSLAWEYTFRVNGYHDASYHFSKDEIAFIHLPKTGGTSLYHLLEDATSFRFVNCGVHRPISRFCDPAEYKYITIIRHPVDRVWSLYQMTIKQPSGYPYRKYALRGLDYFLQNCWEARNVACRYYSGIISREPDAETLEKALANLQAFYAVLSFDHLERDMLGLLKAHHIDTDQIPHKRKSNYSQPTTAERNCIMKFNQLDLQLYEAWQEQIKT